MAQDEVEAVKWFGKAAEQNDAMAQCILGLCYARGQSVVQDKVEAYKWLLLATAQGIESAKKAVSILEKFMTQEQIANGQRLANKFKPRQQ